MNILEMALELQKNGQERVRINPNRGWGNSGGQGLIQELIDANGALPSDCSNELRCLYLCLEYISQQNFDITGWLLYDIPTDYAHSFLRCNPGTGDHSACFDINVYLKDSSTTIEASYLDENYGETHADTIQEAIEKFNPAW